MCPFSCPCISHLQSIAGGRFGRGCHWSGAAASAPTLPCRCLAFSLSFGRGLWLCLHGFKEVMNGYRVVQAACHRTEQIRHTMWEQNDLVDAPPRFCTVQHALQCTGEARQPCILSKSPSAGWRKGVAAVAILDRLCRLPGVVDRPHRNGIWHTALIHVWRNLDHPLHGSSATGRATWGLTGEGASQVAATGQEVQDPGPAGALRLAHGARQGTDRAGDQAAGRARGGCGEVGAS